MSKHRKETKMWTMIMETIMKFLKIMSMISSGRPDVRPENDSSEIGEAVGRGPLLRYRSLCNWQFHFTRVTSFLV